MIKKILNWFVDESGLDNIITQQQFGKKISCRYLYPSCQYTVTKLLRDIKTNNIIELKETKTIPKDTLLSTVNQRQIMPFEILFDIDIEKNTMSKIDLYNNIVMKIVTKLEDDNIYCMVYDSGGKGYHIHVFIKELMYYKYEDRTLFREVFMEYYGKDFRQYIDFQKCSENVTIQLENTKHRNTQKQKICIHYSASLPISDNLRYSLIKNMVCNYNMRIHNNIKLIFNITKQVMETENEKIYKVCNNLDINTDYTMKCIDYFINTNIPEGNRDNILFVLISYWSNRGKYYGYEYGLSFNEIFKLAKRFVEKNGNFITDKLIVTKINNALYKKKSVSCKYKKTILKGFNKTKLCDNCVWKMMVR